MELNEKIQKYFLSVSLTIGFFIFGSKLFKVLLNPHFHYNYHVHLLPGCNHKYYQRFKWQLQF